MQSVACTRGVVNVLLFAVDTRFFLLYSIYLKRLVKPDKKDLISLIICFIWDNVQGRLTVVDLFI